MVRVLSSELEYPGHDGRYYHLGQPFTGTSYTLREDGTVDTESEWRGGLAWGVAKQWYSSGRLASEPNFERGVTHGLSREWREDGQPTIEEVWEWGICVRRKSWDDNGQQSEDYRLDTESEEFKLLTTFRATFGRGRSASEGSQDPN